MFVQQKWMFLQVYKINTRQMQFSSEKLWKNKIPINSINAMEYKISSRLLTNFSASTSPIDRTTTCTTTSSLTVLMFINGNLRYLKNLQAKEITKTNYF